MSLYQPCCREQIAWKLLVMLFCMLLSGCGDSGSQPTDPIDKITSPDDLMDRFFTALIDKDAPTLESMFDYESQRFAFRFREEDVEGLALPTTSLNLAEMGQVWRNLFSGHEIVNHAGQVAPAVLAFEVNRMDRNTSWCGPGTDPMSWWELITDIESTSYHVQFTVVRDDGRAPLVIEGNLAVKVQMVCHGEDCGYENDSCTFYRIEDRSWIDDSMGFTTFGSLVYEYFTNEAPDIVLDLVVNGGNPLIVTARTCDSLDSGIDLRLGMTRWCFEPGGEWTDWRDDCAEWFEYADYGEKTIAAEVRDRWGLSASTQRSIVLEPTETEPGAPAVR